MAILISNKADQISRPKCQATHCMTCRETDEMPDSGAMRPWVRVHNHLNENAAADCPRGGVDDFTEISNDKENTTASYEDRYPIIARHWGNAS